MFCRVLGQSVPTLVRGRRDLLLYFPGQCRLLSSGPIQAYAKALQHQHLLPDDHQQAVVARMQGLYNRLKDYQPPDPEKTQHETSEREKDTTKESGEVSAESSEPPPLFKPPPGLYLHGEVGCGKTALLDLFYNSAPTEAKKRVHFQSFMLHLYSEINRWSLCTDGMELDQDGPVQTIARQIFGDAWLICFDEMQFSDYGTSALLEGLFAHMVADGAVIIATSNRDPHSLGASSFSLESQTKDRQSNLGRLLSESCEIVHIDSEMDYRLVQSVGQQAYFSPISPLNEDLLDQVFKAAVGTENVTPSSVMVYGRKVDIPISTQTGVARFTFSELCRSPLGPADYLTICNNFSTIFIDHIPQMTIYQKNEARRFLSFIDAAYETRTKIFCTAQAEAENLFLLIPSEGEGKEAQAMEMEMIGEMAFDMKLKKGMDARHIPIISGRDEIFSFRRAISRLKEMQSRSYQARPHSPQEFVPYVGTDSERTQSDNRRREMSQLRRQRELEANPVADKAVPLTPMMKNDWGDWEQEASYTTWSRDVMKKELMDKKRRTMNERDPPKFTEEHFWGFGWWERVLKKRQEKLMKKEGVVDTASATEPRQ
ncbi:LACE1 [Branchiostoma lanceolatum]|uniref:LACE1 protein n=1 Tax=Branchiostoma lanceolatum TaxID=7740 RepID=A0A8K0EBN1_BRALA|nr:LACE1 [Branchiostoma lanceolatum]